MSQTEVQIIKADSVVTADIANSAVTDAKISALTSSKLSGALPAISGASLTNLPASGKVHNLVINGSMQVAQRGTSSTSSGYHTVDRFEPKIGNVGVTPTQSQQSTSTSDTPYQNGFSKFLRISIPSAGTANTNAELQIRHKIESQDILNSGWNYKSSSSFLTLSFWFRCSTNQTFYVYFYNNNSGKALVLEFTASGNNTWTKVTKQLKGDSTLVFNADNSEGLAISFYAYHGTAYTNNRALNTWGGYSGTNFSPDMATTWLTAGASTFDITGVQLEVGDSATDFEHRSFGQELLLCQRYYRVLRDSGEDGIGYLGLMSYNYDVNSVTTQVNFIPEMRATPTADSTVGTNYYRYYRNSGYVDINSMSVLNGMGRKGGAFNNADSGNGTAGQAGGIVLNNSSAKIAFSAEL